jgi:hypothetical protein
MVGFETDPQVQHAPLCTHCSRRDLPTWTCTPSVLDANALTHPSTSYRVTGQLGNHDVDILTQLEVLNSTTDTPLSPGSPGSAGGPGYSSWSLPDSSAPPTNTSLDTTGCLVRSPSGGNIWVVHSDGSRNWLSVCYPLPPTCVHSLAVLFFGMPLFSLLVFAPATLFTTRVHLGVFGVPPLGI